MIRPQAVVLPILRDALPGVSVVSVVPDADYRDFPMVSIRRAGGTRSPGLPHLLAQPAVQMTVVSADGLIEAEELYEDALDALFDAVAQQIVIEGVGYLRSFSETQGATESPSDYPDTWAVEGSVRIGLRSSPA